MNYPTVRRMGFLRPLRNYSQAFDASSSKLTYEVQRLRDRGFLSASEDAVSQRL